MEGIPYGAYVVEVDTPMLATRPVEITVDKPEQYCTLSFSFSAPIDDLEQPVPLSIKGKLKSTAVRTRRVWIKVVGVYSNSTIETQSDDEVISIYRA